MPFFWFTLFIYVLRLEKKKPSIFSETKKRKTIIHISLELASY